VLVALKQRQKAKSAAHMRSLRVNDYLTSPITIKTNILSYRLSQEQHSPGLALVAFFYSESVLQWLNAEIIVVPLPHVFAFPITQVICKAYTLQLASKSHNI
jgi:hypothetical protein